VLAHESVSDKVALKKKSKLKSLLSKMSDRRTDLWDYVRAEFASYVNEAIVHTLRIVSEAIENDGQAYMEHEAPELVNAEELRNIVRMHEIYKHPLVSDRVMVFNASKVSFSLYLDKYEPFANTLGEIVVTVLCIKVASIRSLFGSTGPSLAKLRELSVFDVESVIEHSPTSVENLRALHKFIKDEYFNKSFEVFNVVKGMVDLFATGKGLSIARDQIDRVTHEMEDLVEIAGERGSDHLRSFVTFCG